MKTSPKSPYRVVHPSMWDEAWFRELPPPKPSPQLLWLYLRTGPHTTSLEGLYRLSEASLAEELRWPLEELRECWGT